jgi:hypothetical protein
MYKVNTKSRLSGNRLSLVSVLALIGLTLSPQVLSSTADKHAYQANINLIANFQDSGETWLDGGLGRFAYGDQKNDFSALSEVNLAYRYKPSSTVKINTHIQAQVSTYDSSVRELGLIELKAQFLHHIDFNQQVSLKVGQFFLPTSMENISPFWESPYTINFSSLNSWIGEEFRPIGIDTAYKYHFDQGGSLSMAATAFGGNDSMGALLAFRGWSYGRQRTVLGDVLDLPDLNSLQNDQLFGGQRDDGTKPFGRDLDDDIGFALRSSLSFDNTQYKLSYVDNEGDTTLLHGEYAWRTEFTQFGMFWQISDQLEFLSEAMKGSSRMGAGPGVDIDFYSLYGILSYLLENYRLSYRYDQFGIDDKDQMDQENNEIGRSHTLAVMYEAESDFSLGVEVMFLASKRERVLAAPTPYFTRDGDSLSLSFLAQYTF